MPRLTAEELEKMLKDAQQRLRDLDDAIDNVPRDEAPQPKLTPKGAPPAKRPTREQIIEGYERSKAQVIRETKEHIGKELGGMDPEKKKLAMDKVNHMLDIDNARSGYFRQQKDALEKDALFDKATAMHFNRKAFDLEEPGEKPEDPGGTGAGDNKNKEGEEKTSLKASLMKDFRASSAFITELEKAGKEPDKSLEPGKDKGGKEPEPEKD